MVSKRLPLALCLTFSGLLAFAVTADDHKPNQGSTPPRTSDDRPTPPPPVAVPRPWPPTTSPVVIAPTTKPIETKPPATQPVGTTPVVPKPPSVPPPSTQPVVTAKPAFIIGVWYQPVSSFGKWKSRGINTLVGYENEGGNVSRTAWTAAARNAGLTYITQPSSNVASDGKDAYLLAWSQPDEPDGAGNLTPAQIQASYSQLKKQSSKAVFLNLDGGQMQWRPATDYIAYAKGGDLLAFDYYVANRGGAPQEIPVIGTRTTQLKTWGNNKPVLAFIESSDQQLYLQSWVAGTSLAALMRPPTPAEMQAEIDQAVSHGASGIVYFPDIIGLGWGGFDGTTPTLEAQMIKANAALMKTYSAPTPQ